jgi:hypothetical protein
MHLLDHLSHHLFSRLLDSIRNVVGWVHVVTLQQQQQQQQQQGLGMMVVY